MSTSDWDKVLRESQTGSMKSTSSADDIEKTVHFYGRARDCVHHSLDTLAEFGGYVSKISGDWKTVSSFSPIVQAAQGVAAKFVDFDEMSGEEFRVATQFTTTRLKIVVMEMMYGILHELTTRTDGFAGRLTENLAKTTKDVDTLFVTYRSLVDELAGD